MRMRQEYNTASLTGRLSSVVEQLFRKQQVSGSRPEGGFPQFPWFPPFPRFPWFPPFPWFPGSLVPNYNTDRISAGVHCCAIMRTTSCSQVSPLTPGASGAAASAPLNIRSAVKLA